MLSTFDRLPVIAQHLTVLVLSALLGWGTTDLVPFLQDRSPLVSGLVGALLVVLVNALSPITNSYGVKYAPADE
jgi:hypothetical protein